MKKINKLTITSMLVAINIIGSAIALLLKLPVYLDSIGTIMSGMLFGPLYGAVAAIATGVINSTYDGYALAFTPVQLILGILAGVLIKLKSKKLIEQCMWTFVLSIPASIVSAIIVTYLFGTISSSGSSYIVQVLRAARFSDFSAVFTVQVLTDYLDKLIAVLINNKILNLKIFSKLK